MRELTLTEICSKKWHICGETYNATGTLLRNKHFILETGSELSKYESRSLEPKNVKNRDNLKNTNKLIDMGDRYILREDVEFTAPSAASRAVYGSPTNGYNYWLDEKGISLGEYLRPLKNKIIKVKENCY